LGKDANGNLHGGITAPANAPWVITVGAYNDQDTPDTSDDTVATFSSRGPTAIDATAKPDLVAPGLHIVSLNDPNSYLSGLKPGSLVAGTRGAAFPYISLSGTSMAAPADRCRRGCWQTCR
jgi:serine protease AprX